MRFQPFGRFLIAPASVALVVLVASGCREDAESPTGPGGEPASAAVAAAAALPTFITVSAGGSHTCALDGSGKAYCWGSNLEGQLGVEGVSLRRTPTAVGTSLRFL